VNPDFTSFAISSTNPNICPLSWVDNAGQQYTFKLKYQPQGVPPSVPAWPICNPGDTTCAAPNPATHAPIDCTGNTGPAVAWCNNTVFAYSLLKAKRKHYYAVTGAPQQP
jgi:hypothetical protein